ncbi:MAG: hypothetical protein JNM60_09630 [Candidatus Competibacteraceae bacterium]|nr:hypothetical protein [Candidatus Competibacteraceae bacterium]
MPEKPRPARRRLPRLAAALSLCGCLLAPPPADAAIAEFIAAVLKFYLLEQPQWMNHTQDQVDATLQGADAVNRKRLEIWQKEVAMAMMPPPAACATLELAQALRSKDSLIPGLVNRQINQGIHAVIGDLNPVQAVVERVRRHETLYCSASDQARGRCASPGALPNGDMDAGLLLDTRGYSPEQEAAAQAFIENLTAPVPVMPLPAHLEKSPQADQLRGYLISYGARKAVARKVLANAHAERKRADGQSAQEVMFQDYERRYGNQGWVDDVLKAPPGSLEREKLMIETWKMQMQMRQFRQQQDMQVLMATLLDVLNEQQAAAEITRLTTAAARAGVEP